MNFALITTMLTKDLILTSISSSVRATSSLVNYFACSTDNNVDKFKKELITLDLYNSLNVVLTVIEDIIKKNDKHQSSLETPESHINNNNSSCLVIARNGNNNTIGTFGGSVSGGSGGSSNGVGVSGGGSGSNNSIINNQESCIIISGDISITKKSIILPEPVKKALFSTYEIIEKIKIILQQVYKKIDLQQMKYFSSWRSLDLSNEIDEIKVINSVFEKRVKMLFDIIKIYLNKA
jgi:hypothetical protein